MKRFMLPTWVRKHNDYAHFDQLTTGKLTTINNKLDRLQRGRTKLPEVSIVIPAYNEGASIYKTIASLAESTTSRSVEIIVVNNNSDDNTQHVLNAFNVRSFFEPNQGISHARQLGLEQSSGKYILSADADSLYPPGWVDCMVPPLEDPEVSCVYGRYSFIPGEHSSRFSLGIHEICAEFIFNLRRNGRECINVVGFNSAFRKDDAILVGGYDHNLQRQFTGRSEDGWMAYMLMSVGRIKLVRKASARVWTSDRRLMYDGGMLQAFIKRGRKEFGRLGEYLLSAKFQV